MKDLDNFFKPKRIVVIGTSRNPSKVGHVIFKNLIDSGFKGEVIPVNKNAESIFNRVCYKNVLKIKGKVDLAVIAIPAEFVLETVKECNKKGIKDLLIISAGFSEIGEYELEQKLRDFLNRKKMKCIGVNCLGIFDAYNELDTLFLPRYRLGRPRAGGIGFVCQSGAIGSAILDLAASRKEGFSKFISYGNATQIDESDLIDYLGNDEKTKAICLYVEGVKNGDKFYETIKRVSKKKPIIALKGGLTDEGVKATLSHTGSLAGKKEVYFGVFSQANVIRADNLEEMFNIAALTEKNVYFESNKILVITNGGGYGIVSTDEISESKNLRMTKLSEKTNSQLRKVFPSTVNIGNPLDLVGDATTERYRIALEECIKDESIGGILLIVLYQTPLITTDIIEVVSEAKKRTEKPIVVVSTGGDFTEILSESLEETGVPVFTFPNQAISAMDKIVGYYVKNHTLKLQE